MHTLKHAIHTHTNTAAFMLFFKAGTYESIIYVQQTKQATATATESNTPDREAEQER